MGFRLTATALLVLCLGLGACAGTTPAAHTDSSAAPPATAPSVSPALSPTPRPAKPKISKAALDELYTIALGGRDHSSNKGATTIWSQPTVFVHLNGTVSAASRTCAEQTVADFNALSATSKLRMSDQPGDIEIYIVPLAKFTSIDPHPVPGSDATARLTFGPDNEASLGLVLVRLTGVSAQVRCSLMRRELTQAMGMLGDSRHSSSVFSDDDSSQTKYSAFDKEIIKVLYSGAIHPHDNRKRIASELMVI